MAGFETIVPGTPGVSGSGDSLNVFATKTATNFSSAANLTGPTVFLGKLQATTVPVDANDVARKQDVENAVQGIKRVSGGPVVAFQSLALPANTYNNGAGTVTMNAAGVIGAAYFGGVTPALHDRVILALEGAHNWIFTCTTVGTASVAAIFTRAADANTAALIGNARVLVDNPASAKNGYNYMVSEAVADIVLGTTVLHIVPDTNADSVAAEAATRAAADIVISRATTPISIIANTGAINSDGTIRYRGNTDYLWTDWLDAHDFDGVTIAGSITDVRIVTYYRLWVAEDFSLVSIDVEPLNGDLSKPAGAAYYAQALKFLGYTPEDLGVLTITGYKTIKGADVALELANISDQVDVLPFVPYSGLVAYDGNVIYAGASGYLWTGCIDVEDYDGVEISGASIEGYVRAFMDVSFNPVFASINPLNGRLTKPSTAKWYLQSLAATGTTSEDLTSLTISGYRTLKSADIAADVDALKTSAIAASTAGYEIPSSAVSPNQFAGASQDARIRAAIAFVKAAGHGTVVLGTDTVSSPSTKKWTISSSLLVPSNFTLCGNDADLQMADSIFDTIVRNDGIVPNSGIPNGVATALNANQNIRIVGFKPGAFRIKGAAVKYTAPNPLTGGSPVPWNIDTYGWRTIGILIANVQGLEIANISMSQPSCWSISLEHGASDFKIHDMLFASTAANGDGIDIRNGCSNGKIWNIQGGIYDDLIALTAMLRSNTLPSPSIWPMLVGGFETSVLGDDIHDIEISHVRCGAITVNPRTMRMLFMGGAKIYDIRGFDVADIPFFSYCPYLIEIGNSFESAATPGSFGDCHDIYLNDVSAVRSPVCIRFLAPLENVNCNFVRNTAVGGSVYTKDMSTRTNVIVNGTAV